MNWFNKLLPDKKTPEPVKKSKPAKKLTPKEQATKNGESYIDIVTVEIDNENPSYGSFELDWNEHFVEELLDAGYGSEGDEEEQIVDRWFKDIIFNMLQEEGLDTNRGAGYINVVPIDKGKSEVS